MGIGLSSRSPAWFSETAQFFLVGGVFTLFLSMPYAAVLEGFYALTNARPGSARGAVASTVLGFGAGVVVALLFSNPFAWGSSRDMHFDLRALAIFGGIGTVVGTLVAALVFVVERGSRPAR